jgi:hypothetical protein
MKGYRDSVAKRVKAHYEEMGFLVTMVRIEDNTIYIDCDDSTFIERLDDWI